MSRVSIIMVSYRTGPSLWLSIDAALADSECRELIIVNNGNTPGDMKRLEAVAAKEKRITLISGHGNVGFAKGCNIGAKQATGEYILLLNPDAVLPEGGLAKALETLARYPDTTVAGCHLVNADGSEQRGSRRKLLTPKNGISEALGLHRIFKGAARVNMQDTPTASGVQEVEVISGAFVLITRRFYTAIGGMDEGYFLHMDDMDFCYRVHKSGGKILWLADMKVLHFRSTSETTSEFLERQKAKGFVRYLKTHFASACPAPVIGLFAVGIWARYALRVVIGIADRAFVHPLAAKREIARLVLIHRLARFYPKDQSLAGKTIVVAGASGQIGLCVVGMALAHGARVVALYHQTPIAFTHPNLTWVACDLDKTEVYDGMKADALIHIPALWFLPAALAKLKDCGIGRVVAFSSTSILEPPLSKKSRRPEPIRKVEEAEKELARLYKEGQYPPLTLLRPTMVYGVALDNNITRLADVARRFGFLALYQEAKGLRQPVVALDLAEAALAALNNAATHGKTYNLGGGDPLAYRAMAERIFACIGKKPRFIPLPFLPALLDLLGTLYPFTNLHGDMARSQNRDRVFDIGEAARDFGYRPKGFLEGEVVI